MMDSALKKQGTVHFFIAICCCSADCYDKSEWTVPLSIMNIYSLVTIAKLCAGSSTATLPLRTVAGTGPSSSGPFCESLKV